MAGQIVTLLMVQGVFVSGLDKMATRAECLQVSVIVPSAAVPQWYDVVDFECSSMAAMPAAVFIPTKNRKACAPPPLAVEPAMMSAHVKDESGWSLKPGGNAPARREPVSEGDCPPLGNEFRRKSGSLGLSIDFFEVEPARPSAQEMPKGANIRNFRVWMTHSIPTETPQHAKFGRYVAPESETWYPVTHLSDNGVSFQTALHSRIYCSP